MLLTAGIVLIGLATFIVANTFFTEESKFKAAESLEDAEESQKNKKAKDKDIILTYSRPFFRRYVSPVVAQMKNKKKIREKYKRKLASAGLSQDLTPDDFYSFKLFLIVAFPMLFLGIRWFLEATWPLAAAPLCGVVGFFYPDIWISGRIEKRRKEVIRSMPFIVDMLALSVEAGLDFLAAMVKVIERAPPTALSEEFEIAIKEIKIGSSRAEALRNMSWRIDSLPVSSFVATLIAADSVGASIGPILKSLSAELRQKRGADAEKAGATAATKILFPTIMFIMPAVMMVIAAPMVADFIGGK